MNKSNTLHIVYEIDDPTHAYYFKSKPSDDQVIDLARSLGIAEEDLDIPTLLEIFAFDEQEYQD